MSMSRGCIPLVLVVVCALAAKTPQQLKDQFKAALPAGMKAKAAWRYDNTIHVVESVNGIVRNLLPSAPAVRPDEMGPNITSDGTKVFFRDGASNKVYLINWDGTGGYKTVYSGGGEAILHDNFHDAEGEWAVITPDPGSAVIVNIETLAKKNVWTAGGCDATNGFGYDGTYIFSTWNEIFKMARAPNGAPATVNTGGNVCVGTLSPDGSHTCMVQWDAHQEVIQCPNGTGCHRINHTRDIFAKLPDACPKGGDPADWTRFTSRTDYITMYMPDKGENPAMVNLNDVTKWVTMEDACGHSFGRMDVLITDAVGVDGSPSGSASIIAPRLQSPGPGSFSLTGRRLGGMSTQLSFRGIVVHPANGVGGTAGLVAVPLL